MAHGPPFGRVCIVFKEAQSTDTQQLSCLVIDDQEIVRDIVVEVIEELGIKCTQLGSNSEITPSYVSKFDLLITDIRLGRESMSGLQFLKMLRDAGSQIPTLLISGFSYEEIEESCSPENLTLFLGKPFLPQDLIRSVQRILSLR